MKKVRILYNFYKNNCKWCIRSEYCNKCLFVTIGTIATIMFILILTSFIFTASVALSMYTNFHSVLYKTDNELYNNKTYLEDHPNEDEWSYYLVTGIPYLLAILILILILIIILLFIRNKNLFGAIVFLFIIMIIYSIVFNIKYIGFMTHKIMYIDYIFNETLIDGRVKNKYISNNICIYNTTINNYTRPCINHGIGFMSILFIIIIIKILLILILKCSYPWVKSHIKSVHEELNKIDV